MASWTEAEAQSFYDSFKSAYLALSSGVSEYELRDGTRVRRENLKTIKQEMTYWKGILDDIQAGNNGAITAKQGIQIS